MVNGSQQTVCWHVDDIKSSHVEKQVQDDFEEWLIQRYDTNENRNVIRKTKRCCGKRLYYLEMIFDFSKAGKVTVDMQEYVQKMENEFKEQAGPVKEANMSTLR